MPSVNSATSKYRVEQPEWSKHAVIYQVNTRQFSEAGDFRSVQERLPEIRNLGVDILWLMPIHPIGEKNRKGELGSPYAVKDYFAVNPEFGTKDDLDALVDAAHSQNMKVLLDWVPNHSAWDNPLVASHPEWYARDHEEQFRPSPWWDWDDIIEFDYDNKALRNYMITAMKYWVEQHDIDGYRCDVAGYVPIDFWEQVRSELDSIKPVFMLAEWESRDLHEYAFNMTYAWSWNEVMHDIAHQRCGLDKLRKYYSWNERSWPSSAYRMTFVSNHDKNAWDGTQYEQFGEALEAAIVLSVIGEGMPLIYNGQEAGESKRLAFFERDPIVWQAHSIGNLYKALIKFKKIIPALGNGPFGATMIQVPSNDLKRVFSFVRMKDNHKVLVVLNLSPDTVAPTFMSSLYDGVYREVLSGIDEVLQSEQPLILSPWAYRVFYALTGK
ncbi:alpha-amylase family glycosyl hydrolase [Aestuariibacter sp. A3R04]|uniref:alpha-amylase family glycosyl hydrolase n=1 Tax=Aestuariibacter sp. A3R04 TaxID=2841571 RepID=UPI001C0A0376|nr:alpha-amylase family glycosyl hydrolase [Aestuariibacter sp. A3R04]MBU3023338.1 alpha amylase C-terminal domain-containing protein [Aestuariibacter sp. A3R04]